MSHDFANSIALQDQKIADIQQRWLITTREQPPAATGRLSVQQLTGNDLCDEDYVCIDAADRDVATYIHLMNDCDYYEVFRTRWMKRALEWEPMKKEAEGNFQPPETKLNAY